MKLKFWGTRGSIPVPGKDTLKYGGNTPCVEIRSDDGKILILDGGSGIRKLGNEILERGVEKNIDIFITHYHWDHIQGIPFFLPLYNPDIKVTFYGITSNGLNVETILRDQMLPNNFPISLKDFPANVQFEELKEKEEYIVGGLTLKTFRLNHPSPTLTFKIVDDHCCLIYMTDNELNINHTKKEQTNDEFRDLNSKLIEFCRDCDYLIHDTMYDESAVAGKKGWGHSGHESLALFSVMANIKNLLLFHYNPEYSDEKIDQLVKETREILKTNKSKIKCTGAKEGQVINI